MSACRAAVRFSEVVVMPNRVSRSFVALFVRVAGGDPLRVDDAGIQQSADHRTRHRPAADERKRSATQRIRALRCETCCFVRHFSLSTFSFSPFSRSDPPRSLNDPLVGRQLAQSHWPARVQFLRRDADLGAEPELSAVGELRAGVHEHRGRIHFVQESRRRLLVRCDDGLGMPGAVLADVIERLIEAADDLDCGDERKKFPAPVFDDAGTATRRHR